MVNTNWELLRNTAILVFTGLAALFAILNYLRKTIKPLPLKCGILLDDQIVSYLEIATGDPAKRIFFSFKNATKTTLTGLVLELRFFKPLSLSGTNEALSYIPGKTIRGRSADRSEFLIRYSDLEILGHRDLKSHVEFNTQGATPGTGRIEITAYSTEQSYSYITRNLTVTIK